MDNAHKAAVTDASTTQTGLERAIADGEWAERKRDEEEKLQSTLQEDRPPSTVSDEEEWSDSSRRKKKKLENEEKKKLQPTLQEAAPPVYWVDDVLVEKAPEVPRGHLPVATLTPVASGPAKKGFLQAIKRGDSCYEIPTNKIDRTIAKKFGYGLWDGPLSSIIMTYGKEVSHLVRLGCDSILLYQNRPHPFNQLCLHRGANNFEVKTRSTRPTKSSTKNLRPSSRRSQ